MTVLFHLLFEVFRISVLSIAYGFLIWILIDKIFKHRRVKKRIIIPIIFIGLFIWRFSYWRDNGLGDSARVPINSDYEISMIDFWYANIYKVDSKNKNYGLTDGMEKLYLEDGIVYGQKQKTFVVFDSTSGELTKDLNQEEFVKKNGDVTKLQTLDKFHSSYWGMKILLL